MPQAVWTGTISFGLVNIPVRLYPATEPKDVRFHLYDRRSGKRIRYERVTRDYEPPTFMPEVTDGSRHEPPDADERYAERERRPHQEPEMGLPAETRADLRDGVLGLETLYFGDEVRKPEDVTRLPEAAVSARELETAQQLIGAMSAEWIPDKHADAYREELLDLLRSKPATGRAVEIEAATSADAVSDLMAALKASVDAAKAG